MKCKKISIVILVFVFVFIFLISSYILLKDMNELRKNNEATEELIEETIEIKEASKEKYIDWNYLKSINEDIIAWIEIEGTNINYPIIKNENNYYLKHSFDKKYNSNGAIFTTNIFPFKDDETIVYGHNMKNGSMFSNLGKYLNKEFLDLHSKYKIYTVDKRIMDLLLRHGVYKNTYYHIKEVYKLKEYFDNLLGYNLYDLFPEIKENL